MTTLLTTHTRIDSLERVLNILYDVEDMLWVEGRVRRNPGKPRGTDRHAWQKGLTLREAFVKAAETRGFTRHAREQAEAVFGYVYCDRFIRRNGIAAPPFVCSVNTVDQNEHDTREVIRALADAIKRVNKLIAEKEKA